MMRTWLNQEFPTKDRAGTPNGRIIRIWEEGESILGYGPKQVYLTTLAPFATKGPHLHRKRDSIFHCSVGEIVIELLTPNGERQAAISSDANHRSVHVPAGTAAKLINLSDQESLVLNISSGHYDPCDDEDVEDFPNAHS